MNFETSLRLLICLKYIPVKQKYNSSATTLIALFADDKSSSCSSFYQEPVDNFVN
jgi:hypothetical protein